MNEAQALIDRLEAEIPDWGHLPAAMRFKRDAVARFGRDEAFRLCQQHLRLPDTQLLRERPLRGIRATAMASGWHYRELWQGGARFERPLPRVIGAGNHGPLPGLGRSGWLTCIPDAVLRSRSGFVFAGGDALLDFEGEEYAQVEDLPTFDPSVLEGSRERVWTMEGSEPSLRLPEAFLLTGRNAVDFGHWLTEYLPRYVLAVMAGLPEHVPVLIDPRVPRTVREALAAMLPTASRLIEAPHLAEVAVERLWCAANPNFNAYYPARMDPEMWSHLGAEPARFAPLIREWTRLAGAAAATSGASPRVYLARKPTNPKKCLRNYEAIEAIARGRGFAVLYPEDLPLAGQILLARGASHIIAPEGSNALLSCFSRPGSKSLFLSPPYTLPLVDVNGVLAELGIELTVLTGPDFPSPLEEEFCGFWNDYQIDPELFSRVLDDWLPDQR